MLTVQPKITNYTKPLISFKAGEDKTPETGNDAYFEEKVNYYKQQVEEYDKLANDEKTPDKLRGAMNGFKVAAQALLEGWAVVWGGSKAFKVVKSSVIKGADSNFGKQVKAILSPVWKGIKASGKKLAETFSDTITKIKDSKFAEKFTNFVEKMRENKVGKYVVSGFEYIGKAFKYVGSLIKTGYNKVADKFRNKPATEIYDKAANVTATTLGIGTGGAVIYDATIKPEDKKAREEANNVKGNTADEAGDPLDENLDEVED